MALKATALLFLSFYGGMTVFGVADMTAANLVQERQSAQPSSDVQQATARGGPKVKTKVDTGRANSGGAVIVPEAQECVPTEQAAGATLRRRGPLSRDKEDTGRTAAPPTAGNAEPAQTRPRHTGVRGGGRDKELTNRTAAPPTGSNAEPAQARHRGGPRGGGRDKEDTGRANTGGAPVLPPCTTAATPSATTP